MTDEELIELREEGKWLGHFIRVYQNHIPDAQDAHRIMGLADRLEALTTPASGDQMEVVAYKGQSGALYLPHHGDPKEDTPLVTLGAAQSALAERDVARASRDGWKRTSEGQTARAETAEARVAELEKELRNEP